MNITRRFIAWFTISCTVMKLVETDCSTYEIQYCREYSLECQNGVSYNYIPFCYEDLDIQFQLKEVTREILTYDFFTRMMVHGKNVRHIKIINSDIRVIEKDAFQYFLNALDLDLSNNGIVEVNNDAFSNLAEVNYLNLSDNLITEFQKTSLRLSSTDGKSNLKVLNLSNNHLVELIEDLFQYIPSLIELNLQNNQIAMLNVGCFNNLISLTSLNIQNNSIENLNGTLLPLKKLKTLDLSNNMLKKMMEFEFKHLTSLEVLNMSFNLLVSIESNCFASMLNLSLLDLRNNKIRSVIETCMFKNNQLLTYLNLYNNNITTIKDDSFKFNKIEFINLESNNITANLTYNFLNGFKDVANLSITRQHIQSIRDTAFYNMTELQFLNLSRNDIHMVENSSFVVESNNTRSLITFDLSYNHITDISFFEYFTSNITDLFLNDNKINILYNGLFENHMRLQRLDISQNKILVIESGSLSLLNLEYLNLYNNSLCGIIKNNMYSPAQMLQELDLSDFKYTKITEFAFRDLLVLTRLNLSHNELNYVHPTNFIRVDNLHSLDISYNNLTYFEIENILDNVKTINLSNNKLISMPSIFSNKSEVSYLDVSNNNISDINYAMFRLDFLQFLDLSANNISEVLPGTFQHLNVLKLLNLSSNHISRLRFGSFNGLVNVNVIDLSNNKLSSLDVGVFHECLELKELVIDYNDIKSVDVDNLLQMTPNLGTLSLGGNPISCEEIIRNVRKKKSNGLRITSIDKILDEENAHGIRCGVVVNSVSTELPKTGLKDTENVKNKSFAENIKSVDILQKIETEGVSSTALFNITWASVLTVVVLIALGSFYFYQQRSLRKTREIIVQYKNTKENSGNQNDLLLG